MRGGVFVCHASDDAGTAQRAVAALEAAGIPCWIAPRDIEAGETYTQAILDGLDAAPAIVLIFSAATNESPHVARELEAAVGSDRRIIPVRLEAVEPSRSLRYLIGTSQWLEASGAVEAWSPSLVRAVRRAVGRPDTPPTPAPVARSPVPPPTPPSTRAPAGPPTPSATADVVRPGATGPTGRRTALLVGGLVAAVVIAVLATIVLTGGEDPSTSAEDQSATKPPASGASAAQVTEPSQEGSAKAAGGGSAGCWDGTQAGSAGDCPVPTGREGMATVFPGLDDSCTIKESPIEGKVEVYECLHDGFVVRYTRWDEDFDKEKYYDVENEVPSQEWEINGEDAGLQWFSVEHDPEEEQPYQWSAAYGGLPFSLSVEGETQEDRSAGLTELELVPPSQIGLAPQP